MSSMVSYATRDDEGGADRGKPLHGPFDRRRVWAPLGLTGLVRPGRGGGVPVDLAARHSALAEYRRAPRDRDRDLRLLEAARRTASTVRRGGGGGGRA